jgi:hypothetical protein
MIVAYQLEAVDVLYRHFADKILQPAALIAPTAPSTETAPTVIEATTPEPFRPNEEPGPGASHAERASYHEAMALWHRWCADRHANAWRTETQERLEEQEARLEAKEAMLQLLPEILERLGPETISSQQQRQVQAYVKKLHEFSGRGYGVIYDELKSVFQRPRYQDIQVGEWEQVVAWFQGQIQRAKERK